MKEPQDHSKQTKRYLSASGSILLPLALKWRLAYHKCCLAGIAICGTFVSLMLPGLASGTASAASLTVVIPNTPLTVKVSPNGKGATSDPAIVKVSGDVNWGYELKLKSQSGNNDLMSGTNKLPSISDYKDDVSAFDNNTWGYKIAGGSISEKRFRPGPSTDTQIDTTTTAVSSTAPREYQVTLAAKVDASQPAGKYSEQFIFTVTANTVAYTINYNLVGGKGGPSPTTQTGSTDQKTVNISSAEPTKTDHTFKGWCSKETSDATCPNGGITYAKGVPYTLTNGTNTLSLWAMWQDNRTHYSIAYDLNGGLGGPASPQTGATMAATVNLGAEVPTKAGFNFKGWCSANNSTSQASCSGQTYPAGANYPLSAGTNVTLWAIWEEAWDYRCLIGGQLVTEIVDPRDGNTYRVRKFKDGLCWMIDNLRLGDSKLTNRNLDSNNSDLPAGKTFSVPASSTSGFSSDTAANIYVIETTGGNAKVEYGGYYTWCAATANTCTDATSDGKIAAGSICPKGWHLPTKDEFAALDKALGGTGSNGSRDSSYLRDESGPNFQYGGYIGNNSPSSRGSRGDYWSSTAYSSSDAYRLFFDRSHVYPTTNGGRRYGHSVRCVAR